MAVLMKLKTQSSEGDFKSFLYVLPLVMGLIPRGEWNNSLSMNVIFW